jgi:acetolactate synthase-1/2/3 large subunit
MFKPVTKWSTVLGAAGAEQVLADAARVATSPAPGPVYLEFDPTSDRRDDVPPSSVPTGDIAEVNRLLKEARRPVVVVGQGGRSHGEAIASLIAECAVPVLLTYKAVGVISSSDLHFAGLLTGAHMEAPVLQDADVIVAIGLDSIELIPNPWPYVAPVVLLAEWSDSRRYFATSAEVIGPLASTLANLNPLSADWPDDYATTHRERGLGALMNGPVVREGVSPWDLVQHVRELALSDSIATVDAGAHMLAAMPLWSVQRPGQLLISSGLATMGYALPAAIAAAIVSPENRVYCLTGDGGLSMVLGELETVARLNLPITIVVFNDSSLSLIKLKQRPEGNGGSGAVDYFATDYTMMAASVGMAAERVGDLYELDRVLGSYAGTRSPLLLDVLVDPSGYSHVMDIVRGGAANAAHVVIGGAK